MQWTIEALWSFKWKLKGTKQLNMCPLLVAQLCSNIISNVQGSKVKWDDPLRSPVTLFLFTSAGFDNVYIFYHFHNSCNTRCCHSDPYTHCPLCLLATLGRFTLLHPCTKYTVCSSSLSGPLACTAAHLGVHLSCVSLCVCLNECVYWELVYTSYCSFLYFLSGYNKAVSVSVQFKHCKFFYLCCFEACWVVME